MKNISKMNIGELAAFICSYLNDNGINCVLTGGACVSIYTNSEYLSKDIDFIDRTDTPRKKLKEVLSLIGFSEHNRYFIHPKTEFFIEFPSGQLTVGKESVYNVNVINFETGKLLLLNPSDSVKDRLAAFYHWDDLQSLNQAVLIAKKVKINMIEIKKWSINEGNLKKFEIFKSKIKKKC